MALDVKDVFNVICNRQLIEEEKYVRRITPVQFVRNRELGIRGTHERVTVHRVHINNDPIYYWCDREQLRIYTAIMSRCKKEDEEITWKHLYMLQKIVKEIEFSATYIEIPAGIGRCIVVIPLNLERRLFFENPNETKMLRTYKVSSAYNVYNANKSFFERYPPTYYYNDEDLYRSLTGEYFFIKRERKHKLMHFQVQNAVKKCKLCKRIACKCPDEKCEVI